MTVADLKKLITPGTKLRRFHQTTAETSVVLEVNDRGFYLQPVEGEAFWSGKHPDQYVRLWCDFPKDDRFLLETHTGFGIWTVMNGKGSSFIEFEWVDPRQKIGELNDLRDERIRCSAHNTGEWPPRPEPTPPPPKPNKPCNSSKHFGYPMPDAHVYYDIDGNRRTI